MDSISDMDKTMWAFFSTCHAAGPSRCAFYDSSPGRIRSKLNSLYAAIKARPVPVVAKDFYGVVDYELVRLAVYKSLFAPYQYFSPLAEALADLTMAIRSFNATIPYRDPVFRGGEKLYRLAKKQRPTCSDCCTADSSSRTTCSKAKKLSSTTDASNTIMCNDSEDAPDNFADFENYVEDAMKTSEWGQIWSGVRASCM
jgi:hypothetical protein